MHRYILVFLLIFLPVAMPALAQDKADIRQQIVVESIANYPGNCPCPYHLARNGSRCGKRSAYSRQGGAAPLCYPSDVTAEMVARYRKKPAPVVGSPR